MYIMAHRNFSRLYRHQVLPVPFRHHFILYISKQCIQGDLGSMYNSEQSQWCMCLPACTIFKSNRLNFKNAIMRQGCLSVCLSPHLFVCLSVNLDVSVCLCVYLSVYLSVLLLIFAIVCLSMYCTWGRQMCEHAQSQVQALAVPEFWVDISSR